MTNHTTRALASLLLTGTLVAMAPAATVLGAKKDEPGPLPPIESAKGAKYRMANAKMAERVTRFADALGDQVLSDGSPAVDAPAWSDIVSVTVAPTKTPAKLLTKMALNYPAGVPGAFYGTEADWQKGDRAVFVAVEMGGKLPGDAAGQLIEIGLDGDGATSVQAGAAGDPRLGVERFSLSGLFQGGAYGTGTTDVSGRQPMADAEMWNLKSGVFGFYDPKRTTWNLIMPRPGDASSVTVSVDSYTEAGRVVDRLELPGGGRFIGLADPTGGWSKKAGLPPLQCRSLETFSADSGVPLADPGGALIRYTAGMKADADPDQTAALLAPAMDLVGAVPVALTAVDPDAEPLTVEGELAVAPGMNAVWLTFEVPAGQWSFTLGDEMVLTTPAGESIIDHTSLTGTAGVLTGPGLDGFVAGDVSCAIEESEPVEPVTPAEADETAPAEADPGQADPVEEPEA